MSNLRIELNDARERFAPGETIAGTAGWEADQAPERAELRLFWFTVGIGTRDVTLVEVRELEQPRTEDQHRFSFSLPLSPYSFAGSLITLQWAIELVLLPGEETAILHFQVTPTDAPIVLPKLNEPKKKGLRIRAGA